MNYCFQLIDFQYDYQTSEETELSNVMRKRVYAICEQQRRLYFSLPG